MWISNIKEIYLINKYNYVEHKFCNNLFNSNLSYDSVSAIYDTSLVKIYDQ